MGSDSENSFSNKQKRSKIKHLLYHPKKQRKGIKLDRIHPSDLVKYNPQFFCDNCSHYNSSEQKCTIGYRAQHTRAEQMARYHVSGTMALCRFLEID